MRLWSLHPRYLDRMGLLGLWREAILAKRLIFEENVSPKAKHYLNHPQMKRFKDHFKSWEIRVLILSYLKEIYDEGTRRGYKFNLRNITSGCLGGALPNMKFFPNLKIEVSTGQLEFELELLKQKTAHRDKNWLTQTLLPLYHKIPEPNPAVRIIWGPKADWEKSKLMVNDG